MHLPAIDDSMKYCLGLEPFNQQQIKQIIHSCINTFFNQTISTSDYKINPDPTKNQITIVFYTKATLILANSNNSGFFLSSLYNDFQSNSIKVMAFLS